MLSAALFLHGHPVLAQAAPNQTARPAFCIDNGVAGETLTAQIAAGQAATRVDLPAGDRGCCVNFCRQHPSAAGYKVSVLVQSRQVCTLTVANGQVLRVDGTAAKASCTATALQ